MYRKCIRRIDVSRAPKQAPALFSLSLLSDPPRRGNRHAAPSAAPRASPARP